MDAYACGLSGCESVWIMHPPKRDMTGTVVVLLLLFLFLADIHFCFCIWARRELCVWHAIFIVVVFIGGRWLTMRGGGWALAQAWIVSVSISATHTPNSSCSWYVMWGGVQAGAVFPFHSWLALFITHIYICTCVHTGNFLLLFVLLCWNFICICTRFYLDTRLNICLKLLLLLPNYVY